MKKKITCKTPSIIDVQDIGDARSRGGTRGLAATRGIGNIAQVEDSLSVAVAMGDESRAYALDAHQSVALATGYDGYAESHVCSTDSVVIATGKNGKAKAGHGSVIVLVYRDKYNHIKHVKSGIVGRDGIKPDTWYTLNSKGEFVEA